MFPARRSASTSPAKLNAGKVVPLQSARRVVNGSDEPRWRHGTPLVLVEFKNWSGKCGKNEIVQFRDKLENRSGQCRLGFLVSWGGFAQTLTKDQLRNSKGDAVIVPLERKDLEEACASGDVLATLCRVWDAAVLT